MDVTSDPRRAVERLRRSDLAALADRFAQLLVVVFGSVTRSGVPADLDLAVASCQRLDVLAFTEALYDLTQYEAIDVLDLDRASDVAAVEALRGGELLFEAEAGEYNERLVLALARYWDTQWLRDMELEALAK